MVDGRERSKCDKSAEGTQRKVMIVQVDDAVYAYELEESDHLNRAEEYGLAHTFHRHKHPNALVRIDIVDLKPVPVGGVGSAGVAERQTHPS